MKATIRALTTLHEDGVYYHADDVVTLDITQERLDALTSNKLVEVVSVEQEQAQTAPKKKGGK